MKATKRPATEARAASAHLSMLPTIPAGSVLALPTRVQVVEAPPSGVPRWGASRSSTAELGAPPGCYCSLKIIDRKGGE